VSEAEPDSDDGPPLVPRGNRPHYRSGVAVVLAGLALGLLTVMSPSSPRAGVVIGGIASVITALGVLRLIGSFDDKSSEPEIEVRRLAPGAAVAFAGAVATFFSLRAAVAGVLQPASAGIVITLSFMLAVSGVGLLADVLRVSRDDRPFYRREGFWLIGFASFVLLRGLGSHSLTDPWETHYGEVSREILARRDWISLWWAHEEWFWSKPILAFWLQALAMATLGVGYEPGMMLDPARHGLVPWPEWAVRFPIFLLTIAATYILYKGVARAFGRRAGLFGGVVLTTMPQWFFLSHQTMTDMPFVAGLSAALGFFLWGAHTKADDVITTRVVSVGPLRISLSAHQLLIGGLVAMVVPQLVYLVGRNIAFNIDPVFGLRVPPIHWVNDTFVFGSGGGVCGTLPGNKPCYTYSATFPGFHPALQALIWVQALALVVYLEWGERRARRLLFLAAFVAAAIATMGKGPAGLVLPVLAVVGYLIQTRRVRLLLDLEIAAGLAAFAALVMPWFVAMFVRHGPAFVDRLIFHDMVKRAFDHVHDTNKRDDTSFRYYVWQLGYATFPWVALVPAALVMWLRTNRDEGDELDERAMHHYIFPGVPPLAFLVGIAIDRMIERAQPPADDDAANWHRRAIVGAAAICGVVLVFLVGRDMAMARPDQPSSARLLHLFTYNYEREWPANLSFSRPLWGFTLAAMAALVIVAIPRLRKLGLAGFGAVATVFAVFALDVYFPAVAPHFGQRETSLRYYVESTKNPGPLIAYQMNWKGENFYNGNQVAIFAESGKPFRDWLAKRRKQGQSTFYVVLLANRFSSLQSELGETKTLDALTTPEENNKFVLYRAVYD
jgi:4-amino-4-deoxy-L-arabinose transferase-like glycosyltransferase